MSISEFYGVIRGTKIHPQLDVEGDLNVCMKHLVEDGLHHPEIYFVCSKDKRIKNENFSWSFIGTTVDQAFTKIENEYPVEITVTETMKGKIILSLEYKWRYFKPIPCNLKELSDLGSCYLEQGIPDSMCH